MASGDRHTEANLTLLRILCAIATLVAFIDDPLIGLAIFLGALCGTLITPDIDMHNRRTAEENRIYRIRFIGPVIGFLWQVYWYPYALVIPHRHWLSHLPGLSTAIRMLYLCLIPISLYVAGNGSVTALRWNLIAIAWMSWTILDIGHLALDGFRMYH